MKHLFLPLGFLALFSTEGDLATRYVAEHRIETVCELDIEWETTSFSMERDGEPVEPRFGGGGSTTEVCRIVLVDEIIEVGDDGPALVHRTFETLENKIEIEREDGSFEREVEAPLAGLTLGLSVDEDGDVDVEVVDGDIPEDEACLEGHLPTLCLDALLPEDAVESGDTWRLEAEQVLNGISMAVFPALFPPNRDDEEEPERGRGRGGRGGFRGPGGGGGGTTRMFLDADWDAYARLESLEEEWDGRDVALIKLTIEGSGEIEEPEGGGFRGRRGRAYDPVAASARTLENSYEIELEGELYFDLKAGRPIHMELEGGITNERDFERSGGGGSMRIMTTREAAYSQTITISAKAGD